MLKEILGEKPYQYFLECNYAERPHALPSAAARISKMIGWEEFWNLIPAIAEKEILVVRNGMLFPDVTPRDGQEGKALLGRGYSLVLRHVENAHLAMRRLAADMEKELDAEVVIQLYATPAGFHSFGWHYDAEEVFVIQVAGEKEYYLRRNTVNPRPTVSRMPKNMKFELETTPFMGSHLIAGDFLYIPGGWWHVAKAIADSLSISVGALPRNNSLEVKKKKVQQAPLRLARVPRT